MNKVEFNEKINQVKALLVSGNTGEQIYYSTNLQHFREIAAHYERLAVLIKLNYIEFPVIFDIISRQFLE